MKKSKLILLQLSILALISFSQASDVYSQSVREQSEAAIGYLLAGDKKLTKNEYEYFWKMLPPMSNSEKDKLIAFLKPEIADGLEYQKNLWVCVRDAWITQRTPECKSAFKIFEKMVSRSKSLGRSTEPMMDSLENSKRLLTAAASRNSMKSYNGQEVYLSLDVINQTISKLDIKFSRVKDALK